ncbi:MAG: PQQ-like beta-propeller repeat protein, partial [Planctomycetes bacterium]|nr:PQQ-like beta-propeller repeat protein [Planctomycetota bacterium]
LDALSSLAPLGLRERALKIGSSLGGSPLADFGDWDEWVWENQPLDADPAKWRRACGLALLLSNQDVTIMNAVLDGLLRESLSAPGPLDRKLAVLDDAALVRQLHSSTDCQRFAGHFHDLGRQLLRQDDLVGFDSLRHALMRIPRFSYSGRIEALDPMLLRHTLEARATRCRWDAAARLCRQLRFWAEQPIPKRRWSSGHASLQKTAGWAEASASSRLPELKPDDGLVLDPQWRHPVYIDLNKEAENTLLEMRLALRDQEWRFACQGLLGSTAPQWGLVSDQADEQRFRSFSAILSSTMQENPELVRAMGETLGDAELMRLHRAQAAGDVATVEKAAVQYYGTTAAADALAWLGDHRLARGEFTLAIMCYEQAMPVADPPVRAQLAARIRLASAILGHDHGEAVTEPVRFGPEELSPAEFERLAAEMLAAHQSPNSEAADNSNGPAPGLPAPARMTVRSWGQLDGAQGTKPEQVPGGSRSVDWSGRQHAMVVADNSLVVSNRFHVAAFDVPTAKQRWAYDLGDAQGATHAWPMVPMRPLVAGGRVYTRLLRKDGHPDLVCLDLSTGNHVWSTQYPGTVGSDPVVVGDRLVCLCEPHTPGEPVGQLTLTSFSLATGAILDEARLVTLGSQWRSRRVCQLTLVGDRIVAVVAGAVICCDTAGQLRWIRRNTWLPAPLDPYWSRQAIGPPIVVGDRVLATQPGAKTIDCLDLATGRLDWRAARSTLHRMLGTIDQTLVIQTDEGLAAISLDSGEELWHRPIPDLLEGALMGAAGRVICVRHFEGTQVPYATLQWLDGRTGQLLGRQPFWTPSPKYVLVGPLASDGKRAWALAAVADEKGKLTPRRELVELAFEGSLPMVAEPLDGWNPSVPPALRAGAEIVLPGWTLLSAREDKHTGLQAELNGHANALVTRADTTPVRLIRRMRVPDQGKLQMVLDFGHDPHSQSRIEVRVAGLPVWQHFTPAKVAPNPEQPPAATWTQHTVDLSDYTGKDIWITVQQSAVAGGTGYAWWRRLELQQ